MVQAEVTFFAVTPVPGSARLIGAVLISLGQFRAHQAEGVVQSAIQKPQADYCI